MTSQRWTIEQDGFQKCRFRSDFKLYLEVAIWAPERSMPNPYGEEGWNPVLCFSSSQFDSSEVQVPVGARSALRLRFRASHGCWGQLTPGVIRFEPDALGFWIVVDDRRRLGVLSMTEQRAIETATAKDLVGLSLSSDASLTSLEVLCNLQALQSLNVEYSDSIQTLEGISSLISLEDLNAKGCRSLRAIHQLTNMTSLRALNLWWLSSSNTASLSTLTSLRFLALQSCESESVGFLSKLSSLEELDLSGSASLQELQPLATLGALQVLDLSTCKRIQDISPLANLTSLVKLNLSECSLVQDLTPVASLKSLQEFRLTNAGALSDISSLTNVTHLKHIDLSGCEQLSTISPLTRLPELTTLILNSCKLLSDLELVSSFRNLRCLELAGCSRVDDIQWLSQLPFLSALNLSGCENIKDCSPIAHLHSLRRLDLSSIPSFDDVGLLSDLTSLEQLALNNCRGLTSVLSLASLPSLKSLELQGEFTPSDVESVLSAPQLESINAFGNNKEARGLRLSLATLHRSSDLYMKAEMYASTFVSYNFIDINYDGIRLVRALEALRTMKLDKPMEPLLLSTVKAFWRNSARNSPLTIEAPTWQKFFDAVLRYPDSVCRSVFEAALEKLASPQESIVSPTSIQTRKPDDAIKLSPTSNAVLVAALSSLIRAPKESRAWSTELIQRTLNDCTCEKDAILERAAEKFFQSQGIDTEPIV